MIDVHSIHYLGDEPFFCGERPTTADAVVYVYMASLIEAPFKNPPARDSSPADFIVRGSALRARV